MTSSKFKLIIFFIPLLLFANIEDSYAQVGTFKVVNRLTIDDELIDRYVLKLEADSISGKLVSFASLTSKELKVKEFIVDDNYITYLDNSTGAISRKKCKNSIIDEFKEFNKYYYFEPNNKKYCDETQFVFFKDKTKIVIVFSFSCQLHEHFFSNNNLNFFNLNIDASKIIKNIKPSFLESSEGETSNDE